MKVIYSNKYSTLMEYERHVACFEDLFPNKVWDEYSDCWRAFFADGGLNKIKCKTRDAILSIPEDLAFELIRVGQSIRESNKGEIIVTPGTVDVFKMLET